jgi:hypothetical protein
MGSGCWRVSSNWGTHTWDMLEERRGELAEQEGEDKGGGEEAAVGEARGAAGHGRCRRRAEVAGAARADGRQARCAPHPAAAILSLPRAEPGSSCSSSALDPLSLRDSRVGVLRSSSLSVRPREISIFNPKFVYLSRFDIQFVCSSKYNSGHANSFNTRDFSLFHTFFIFNISFWLFISWKKTCCPWLGKKRSNSPWGIGLTWFALSHQAGRGGRAQGEARGGHQPP